MKFILLFTTLLGISYANAVPLHPEYFKKCNDTVNDMRQQNKNTEEYYAILKQKKLYRLNEYITKANSTFIRLKQKERDLKTGYEKKTTDVHRKLRLIEKIDDMVQDFLNI